MRLSMCSQQVEVAPCRFGRLQDLAVLGRGGVDRGGAKGADAQRGDALVGKPCIDGLNGLLRGRGRDLLTGLPQTAVRSMGFKNTKSLHSAMWIGALTCSFIIVGMHMAGTWAGALVDTNNLPTSDYYRVQRDFCPKLLSPVCEYGCDYGKKTGGTV